MALMGLVENCIMRSMVSSVALGPTEQFSPITSTGHESISRVKVSVSVPPGRWPKSSMVTCAMTAISLPAGFARGEHRFAQFVQIAEGLEDQEVDAGLHQRIDLLAECRAGLGERRGPERLDAHAQRSDRRPRRTGRPWRLRGPVARPRG